MVMVTKGEVSLVGSVRLWKVLFLELHLIVRVIFLLLPKSSDGFMNFLIMLAVTKVKKKQVKGLALAI